MFAIIDKRASQAVKDNLKLHVEAIFEFSSEGIVYNSISGHPDIFMFQDGKKLIIAPNAPIELIAFLQHHTIDFEFGEEKVGESLLESSRYNCLSTESHYFLRKGHTDAAILEHCKDKEPVFVPQSYVRCSLFNLTRDQFITSDKGILKSMNAAALETFYFDPIEIGIKDHAYGFLGGTVGKMNDTLFFIGDIFKHSEGMALAKYITQNNLKYVCLGNDFLYDGGGLFFVESL